MARLGVGLSLVLFLTSFSLAQSDAEALKLAAESIAAMTGGNPINDVTLTGDATWIAGSDKETGSVTLLAKGTAESRIDLDFSDGARTEIRNDLGKYPAGAYRVKGGDLQESAMHNCWVNAGWFFPARSFLNATADPNLIFSYVGLEKRGDATVHHILVVRTVTGMKQFDMDLVPKLSATDYYLDSTLLLPVAITFNTHPDDDALSNISLEIDFSSYQTVDGFQIPLHVQKLIFGGVALDVTVSKAVFNSGLSDDLFAVP